MFDGTREERNGQFFRKEIVEERGFYPVLVDEQQQLVELTAIQSAVLIINRSPERPPFAGSQCLDLCARQGAH